MLYYPVKTEWSEGKHGIKSYMFKFCFQVIHQFRDHHRKLKLFELVFRIFRNV